MAATLIDGKAIALKVRQEVAQGTRELKEKTGRVPGLAVIRVGEDPASKIYVTGKQKAAAEVGFHSTEHHFPETASHAEVQARLEALNADDSVHGILVQLPVPKQVSSNQLLRVLTAGEGRRRPARAERRAPGAGTRRDGRLHSLGRDADAPGDRLQAPWQAGGRGRPEHPGGTPHGAPPAQRRRNGDHLPPQERPGRGGPRADILVAAVGVPELIKGAWVKPGAVVIDVGINRLPSGKLVGDVEFAAAAERASHITPVPGGVGPMTIAMLLSNTLRNARALIGS